MKNSLKYIAIIVLVLSLIFGKYIGRWIVDKADNSDTRINIGQPFVFRYLKGCDTLHLVAENFTSALRDFRVRGAFNSSKADNTAYLDQQTSTFFDGKKRKFFRIYYFFSGNSTRSQLYDTFISDVEKNGAKIVATINKTELLDENFGTKEKPVPIVYFEVPGKMNSVYDLVGGEGGLDYGNETEFRSYITAYNIRNYLSYVKSKADFEQMFGSPEK